MSNKYIIKNCPALQQTYYCNTHHSKCQDCTNCVMKQIVELCKRDKNFCVNCRSKADDNIDCIECIEGGRAQLAQDILQLLQIEEVK